MCLMRVFFFENDVGYCVFFFFSSRRRHTRLTCDWSSDVCSSDLADLADEFARIPLGLALDLGVVILDLLAVRRESRRAAVLAGDHDHRFGLGDRQMILRGGDLANGIAHASHILGIHLLSAAAAASHSAAAAEAAPKA